MKKDKPFSSIQSGKFKGKKLFLPSFQTTRSTKNRVKACVFNTLRYKLKDHIFIEVFGGSGSMAFEALSNDALSCIIIEKDEKAYKIALKNAALFEEKDLIKIHQNDSFELLPSLLQKEKTPIIAYFDPPFDIRAGFLDIYERIFSLINSLQGSNLKAFIIEHSSQRLMPEKISLFSKYKFKKFGKTSLSFYEL